MVNALESCFAVLMLLYLSSGFTGFLSGDSPLNLWRVEDNPLLLAIQMAMYGVTLGFIALHWRKLANALQAGAWSMGLAFFAVASTLWSSDPAFTLRRSLVVVATTVFGIYFGSLFELPRQLRLLVWAFALLAVLSAGCALWFPQYGIDNQLHHGDWQGVLGQKNLLGKAMVVAIVVLWSAKGAIPRVLQIVTLPVCAVVMLMSQSLASLLVCGALLVMAVGYRALRARLTTLVPIVVLVLLVVSVLMLLIFDNGPLALAYFGRSTTLSRRTEIWRAVWSFISAHMLLGYGFSSFWAGMQGESALVAARLGFVARHAHNGFLDLWLELGIVGLLIFAVGYFQAVRQGVLLVRSTHNRFACWPLLYFTFMLLYDLVEGPILRQNNLYWALYVAATVSATQAARVRCALRAALPITGPHPRLEQHPDYLS